MSVVFTLSDAIASMLLVEIITAGVVAILKVVAIIPFEILFLFFLKTPPINISNLNYI